MSSQFLTIDQSSQCILVFFQTLILDNLLFSAISSLLLIKHLPVTEVKELGILFLSFLSSLLLLFFVLKYASKLSMQSMQN